MGRKIFISYKYGDTNVYPIEGVEDARVRDYVDVLQGKLYNDHINKGEKDDESMEGFKDETIASKLRDKIYDSSITLVMISKNMKNLWKLEKDQWIPWEISYSLKEHSRNGKVSKTNAVLAVVIPDQNNSYDYYIKNNACGDCKCLSLTTASLFNIIGSNMFNRKTPEYAECSNPFNFNKPQKGYSSYIHSVKWDDFVSNIDVYLNIAFDINKDIDSYNITKIMT